MLDADHPFLHSYDQDEYTQGIKRLNFDEPLGVNVSESWQEFIKRLIAPNLEYRLMAEAAISHN
jgi:hypothetical protein